MKPRRRNRLALRIYAIGIAQVAAIGVILFIVTKLLGRPPGEGHFRREARYVGGIIAALVDQPAARDKEVERIQTTIHSDVAIFDENDKLLYASPGAPADLVAARAADIPGEPWHAMVVPVDLPSGKTGSVIYHATPTGPPPFRLTTSIVLLIALGAVGVSGSLTALWLARPLERLRDAAQRIGSGDLAARAEVDRNDELGDVAVAFDDMAERIGQLFRAQKELLANVSHELRTPLARIHVAVDLAAEGDADMAREALSEIAEDLSELERLVDDVLTSARLEVGTGPAAHPIHVEQFEVHAILERAASRFRNAHPARPLNVEVGDDLPELTGDPMLIRRVVDNLLENADKYSENANASVTVSAKRDGAGIAIEVRDHGIGIPATDLPRVFTPFFRGDPSRTRKTGGLGLGLSLSKRIIEAHGGSIALTSEPGVGTIARVTLPHSMPAEAPVSHRALLPVA
ncbi:MAG TPA: HAMP domain-containing sensor histidine kinase [Kofleriaceae bacterium]